MREFKKEVRKTVFPYYKTNDKSHRINHADTVCELALKINASLDEPLKEELVILAAYYHDIHSQDRANHHTMAAKHVLETDETCLSILTEEERLQVSKAIAEHRASYKGTYSSLLSEVISSADRGKPGQARDYLKRSYDYAKSELGLSEEEALHHSRIHIKEKFGSTGYAVFPAPYIAYFGDVLKEMQIEIDTL